MREIKFRAWSKKEEVMLHSHTIQEFYEMERVRENNKGDNLIWLQYTGLKDKNGKEIYEGDIVKNIWTDCNGEDIGNLWVVEFGEYDNSDIDYGSPAIGFYANKISREPYPEVEGLNNLPTNNRNSSYKKDIVIIGNIYENPELLKED